MAPLFGKRIIGIKVPPFLSRSNLRPPARQERLIIGGRRGNQPLNSHLQKIARLVPFKELCLDKSGENDGGNLGGSSLSKVVSGAASRFHPHDPWFTSLVSITGFLVFFFCLEACGTGAAAIPFTPFPPPVQGQEL